MGEITLKGLFDIDADLGDFIDKELDTLKSFPEYPYEITARVREKLEEWDLELTDVVDSNGKTLLEILPVEFDFDVEQELIENGELDFF